MTEQLCNKCNNLLDMEHFYFRKDTSKYEKTCKTCRNKIAWQRKVNGMVKHHTKFDYTCIKCKTQKTKDDFYIKDKSSERYDTVCKDCRKLEASSLYVENKTRIRENQKKWYTKNRDVNLEKFRKYYQFLKQTQPEKLREEKHQWRLSNKDKLNELSRVRYHTDQNNKLGLLLRQSCRYAIKNKKYSSLLGCHGLAAQKWLEYQFTSEMSWVNYGKYWVIDHFIPIDCFDLSVPEQQKDCFHWTNTRPMTRVENAEKGNKLPSQEQVKLHNQIIEEFLEPIEIEVKSTLPVV